MLLWTEWIWIMKVQEFSSSIRKYKCLRASAATTAAHEGLISGVLLSNGTFMILGLDEDKYLP